MSIYVGSIVIWDTSSNMHKSQNKIASKNPDYLLIISNNSNNSFNAVPCWKNNPGYTLCISAKPQAIYVDAKKIISVKLDNITISQDYILTNIDKAIKLVKDKNQEIKEKKHLAKLERNKRRKEFEIKQKIKKIEAKYRAKAKRERIESTYGREYELAVINNDKEKMRKIEAICGCDPRPKKGYKSSSKLGKVINIKPCIGGRVSPK